jgi:hypothetical protein
MNSSNKHSVYVCISLVFISRLKHELNPNLRLLENVGSVSCSLFVNLGIIAYNILGPGLNLAFQNIQYLFVYVTVNCGSELQAK